MAPKTRNGSKEHLKVRRGAHSSGFVLDSAIQHLVFSQKRLRCLDSLLQAPVWVFQRTHTAFTTLGSNSINASEKPLLVALYASDIEDLWGPALFASNTSQPGTIKELHLSRGFIAPETADDNSSVDVKLDENEILAHFSLWPQYEQTRRTSCGVAAPDEPIHGDIIRITDIPDAEIDEETHLDLPYDASDTNWEAESEWDSQSFLSTSSDLGQEVSSQSQGATESPDTLSLDLGKRMVIGARLRVETGKNCPLTRERFMLNSEISELVDVAINESRWRLDTAAVAGKLWPFDIISPTLTFKKLPARSRKEVCVLNFQTVQPYLDYLHERTAIALSACTRVAQRVPLYKVFKEPRVKRYVWKMLKEELSTTGKSKTVLNAFDGGMDGFYNLWINDSDLQPVLKKILKLVMTTLAWTGDLEDGRFCVWYTGTNQVLPLHRRKYPWISMLQEHGQSVAFAYFSDKCIQCRHASSGDLSAHPPLYRYTGIITVVERLRDDSIGRQESGQTRRLNIGDLISPRYL